MDRVYLLSAAKTFFNALHSRQPFQGGFADVKSLNIKDRLGYRSPFCKRNHVSGTYNQENHGVKAQIAGYSMLHGHHL